MPAEKDIGVEAASGIDHLPQPTLQLVANRPIDGYLRGIKQPSLLVSLLSGDPAPSAAELESVDRMLRQTLGDYQANGLGRIADPLGLLPMMAAATHKVLVKAGIPSCNPPRFLHSPADKPGEIYLMIPSLHEAHQEILDGFQWVLSSINRCIRLHRAGSLSPSFFDGTSVELAHILQRLKPHAPQGMNSLRFLQAADAADIPWRRVSGNLYQFGWGARSRWLDSSFTEMTSGIGGKLARDKIATAKLLRTAGLPAPSHALAQNEQQALALAQRLGYPVVVKPADLDGGRGVFAGISNATGVKKAFAKARGLSKRILVEKHFEGRDYRLQVFQNQVYWVSYRIPGGVTGDGLRSVAKLLSDLNTDPDRGEPGSNSLLKRIDLDDEVQDLLDEQQLTAEDIPAEGRFIRLRRAANVASGGTIVPALDIAHPDNLALGARAAAILRLDIAGVDLLIPDIRRSWLETGAVICEVNAQPQLSPTLHPYLLERLLTNKGRIPVIVIFGVLETTQQSQCLDFLIQSIKYDHSGKHRSIGFASPEGVRIDGKIVAGSQNNPYDAALVLLSDPQIQIAVLHWKDDRWLHHGMPIDRFNVLLIGETGSFQQLEHNLSHHCSGPVIRLKNEMPSAQELQQLIQTIEAALT